MSNIPLFSENTIILYGDIDRQNTKKVLEELEVLTSRGVQEIQISIDSAGGAASLGFEIHDAIKEFPGKVTGLINLGAASMAVTVLQACDQRICAQSSKIRVHGCELRATLYEIEDKKGYQKKIDQLRRHEERNISIYLERTSMERDDLIVLLKEDKPMSARQALELGFIDAIID